MTINNKHDCYSITLGLNEFPIGRIKQDTLYLDNPSRFREGKAYGLDRKILITKEMDYQYLIIRERGQDWTTSREFWLEHGTDEDLNNGRNEVFLPDELFGADKAIIFKEYMDEQVQKWLQFDIFDLAHYTGSWKGFDNVLPYWEKALSLRDRYTESLNYSRKVEL